MLKWYDLNEMPTRPRTSSSSFPMRRFNKFFDTQKTSSPDQSDVDDDGSKERIPLLEIEPRNQVRFAHYGYVYCLHLGSLPHSSEQLLFSGTSSSPPISCILVSWILTCRRWGWGGEIVELGYEAPSNAKCV